jgi:hypothetical protein
MIERQIRRLDNDLIYVTDPKGIFILRNKAWERMPLEEPPPSDATEENSTTLQFPPKPIWEVSRLG